MAVAGQIMGKYLNLRFFLIKNPFSMLIIDVKDNESIDRALKKYKRKFDRSGVMKELRRRKHYTKPSIKRRNEMLKAVYKQKMYGENSSVL